MTLSDWLTGKLIVRARSEAAELALLPRLTPQDAHMIAGIVAPRTLIWMVLSRMLSSLRV